MLQKNEEAGHGPDPCLLMSPAPQSLELRAVDRAWRMNKLPEVTERYTHIIRK